MTEMIELQLDGLGKMDMMAYMAAIGCFRLVSDFDPSAKSGWTASPLPTMTIKTKLQSREAVTKVVVDYFKKWKDPSCALHYAWQLIENENIPKDKKKNVLDLKEPRKLMKERLQSFDDQENFMAGLTSDIATRTDGQSLSTGFRFTGGRELFLQKAYEIFDALDGNAEEHIRNALWETWKKTPETKSMHWSVDGKRERAYLPYNPEDGKKNPIASVPGAEYLAFQSLPMFPVAARQRGGTIDLDTTCVLRSKKQYSVSFPLWGEWLSIDEVRIVLGWDGLHKMAKTEQDARGIVGICRYEINSPRSRSKNVAMAEML